MTKAAKKLSGSFRPEMYILQIKAEPTTAEVVILGQKVGRPSHRITLHQKGLRITIAKIAALDKNGQDEIGVTRINHLPTVEQVRIHTKQVLYPGRYQLNIGYQLPASDSIKAITPDRESLPCVDEAEAWQNAKLEIKQ